ncbi:hypothetical protein H5410_038731 [Solanum commersonii]|uniref:Uncharacterized protein n=1 Tax=Solanum commersonii TaxID=4109 RepID=A0A9J5Y9U0_SOLCO|nr:hypothetical protein H5410_038731 [Solanum commersonii]
MANLLAVENWTWIDGCDDLSNFDASQIDDDIVMSLLDDMQGDDNHDDERLTSVIRSLEAEIDQTRSYPTFNNVVSELAVRVHGHDSFQDKQERNYNGENFQSQNTIGQCQSEDFVESNDLDFSWMEMEMEMVPSYPSDEMNLWYMDNNYGQEAELEYPNIKGDCIFDDDNIQNLNFIDNLSLNFYHCEDSSEELVDVDDFCWMDTEMSSLTSPSNNNMIEFQNFITCIPIEDEVYDSLWLQTDLTMVDNISQ